MVEKHRRTEQAAERTSRMKQASHRTAGSWGGWQLVVMVEEVETQGPHGELTSSVAENLVILPTPGS